MKIIDDFMSEEDFTFINDLMTSPDFDWYYRTNKTYQSGDQLWNKQFIHSFFNRSQLHQVNSKDLEVVDLFSKYLDPYVWLRVRANLTMSTDKIHPYAFHNDTNCPAPWTTAVFYLNSNNGMTLFDTGEEVKSKENRIVIFDGTRMHAGTTHTDSKHRMVVNLNYIPKLSY